MADVFVSYARSDKPRVAPVVAAIEAQGWSVWWDPAIDPGQEFDRTIDRELKAAAAVVVVWTPQSVTSRWVRGEARDGADRGILVPIRFGGADLPVDVRALHTTDFDAWREDPGSPPAQELLRALRAVIMQSRTPRAAHANPGLQPPAADAAPARVAICVLPFVNMSGDPEQEYFSDGITEDIITELSRWRLLAVRSRSAAFRYRGTGVDMKQVARELAVRFIVEGSVRRMGARVRISAQLIDTETGSHVWAEKFDRELADVFAVQDQVVQTLVSTLVGRVQVSDSDRVRRRPPAHLAAYECVLKGNALPWDEPAPAAEAAALFEQAITIDPGYGLAHALLAVLFLRRWNDDLGDSDVELQQALQLAQRAVDLDPSESTCFSILGHAYLYRRSFDLALQQVQRATEMNPNNQWNAADMGVVLTCLGQAEEALAWFKRAKEIDPYFDPPWYWRAIGEAQMGLRRYREALAAFEHLPGKAWRLAIHRAGCYGRLGDHAAASANAAESLALKPGVSIGHFIAKQPFKNPADAAALAESLRLAGLPE